MTFYLFLLHVLSVELQTEELDGKRARVLDYDLALDVGAGRKTGFHLQDQWAELEFWLLTFTPSANDDVFAALFYTDDDLPVVIILQRHQQPCISQSDHWVSANTGPIPQYI